MEVPAAAPASAPAAKAARESARGRGELLLLGILIGAHLAPLLLLPAIPTQDGPSHRALSYALRIWEEPAAAPLRRYLVRNEEAVPNWFVFLLEAELLRPLSLQAAERALLAGYVVLLPLALRYALRGVHPEAGFLAALGVPFTYNYLLNLGFFNFCWSLVAFLFALGWFLRGRERPPWRRAGGLAALALWVYACHGIAFVMLALAVGTLSVAWGWREARGGGWDGALAALRRRLPALLALLPGAALLLAFLGPRLDGGTGALPLAARLYHLPAIYSLVSFDRRTVVFSAALGALLLGLAAWRWLRHRDAAGRGSDGLLAVAAVFVLVYLAAPNDLAGGGYVTHRLNLFPPLALLLWLGGAAPAFGARRRVATSAAGAVVALGLLSLLTARWSVVDDLLRDYRLAAERVPAGATALPLSYAHAGGRGPDGRALAFRVQPYLHALGYASARSPIVDLGLYGASEDYFPLRYRRELDPYHHLGRGRFGMEGQPPNVDIPGYERRTGGRVDYVLVWQPGAAPARHPSVRDVRRQLEAGYERAYVSPRGLAELWRRRG